MCTENPVKPSRKSAATVLAQATGRRIAEASAGRPSAGRKSPGKLSGHARDFVRAIAAEFDADAASIWLYDRIRNAIRCVFHDPGRLPQGEASLEFKDEYAVKEIPSWQSLKQAARPVVLRHCARNSMLWHASEWLAARQVETTLLIPIREDAETAGWFLLFHREPMDYRPADLHRAASRGRDLALALEFARAAAEEKESAIFAERNRIARELHDTLAQGFTSILLQIEAAKSLLGEAEKATFVPLDRARDLARESLAEARRAIWAFRPRALDKSDLPTALEWLVRNMAAGSGVGVEFTTRGAPRALTVAIETNLLRIIQEAVTNALRHAAARTIRVRLTFANEVVRVSVEDDGRGLAPRDARSGEGFGLISMRERVENLSGKFLLSSHPSRGTRILVKIPIPSAWPG